VLSRQLALVELDGRHWRNWWDLLVPPGVLDRPAWALAIVGRREPLEIARVIVAGKGAVDATLTGLDPGSLRALARRLDVSAVVAIETGALARFAAEVERALDLDQDLVEQGLIAWRALKRMSGRGVWSEPHLLELLPAPAYEPMQKTFDLLVPDDTALLAYVIEDDGRAIHASILARKRGGDIDLAATHRLIADLVPEDGFARDWRKQTRRVIAAVEERVVRPSIGLFLERETLLRIVTGPADQLGRELNARNVILDPAPAWLLGLLGGATVAAVATRGARALASFLPQAARDRASALAQRAQTAMKESGAHPFALLGFDPLELWANVRHFYRR